MRFVRELTCLGYTTAVRSGREIQRSYENNDGTISLLIIVFVLQEPLTVTRLSATTTAVLPPERPPRPVVVRTPVPTRLRKPTLATTDTGPPPPPARRPETESLDLR